VTTPAKLRGVSDLREFFRTNQRPIYFVSPTAFNLLGIDRWVREFRYVCHCHFAGTPVLPLQAQPVRREPFKLA